MGTPQYVSESVGRLNAESEVSFFGGCGLVHPG